MDIRRTLAERDPGNTEWQRDLIVSHVKIAEHGGNAVAEYDAGLRIAQSLQEAGRLRPIDAWMVDDLERRLSEARAQ